MKRMLMFDHHTIELRTLGHPLDAAFDQLYAAYLSDTRCFWDELNRSAQLYFDHHTDSKEHNWYFESFAPMWNHLLKTGRHREAAGLWRSALRPALDWEAANRGKSIHKGTPYYFWAMSAILMGDIDGGYLLAHQALDEDIRTTGHQSPNAPALALVSLNYAKPDQAFHQWVKEQAAFVDGMIADYRACHNSQLTLDDFKQRFLEAPPSTETLFQFSYTVARLWRLRQLQGHTANNDFAGQLEINLLFDLTLVIDSAVKSKNPSGCSFRQHASHLLNRAGAILTENQLGEINGEFKKTNNFDGALTEALDGTMKVPLNTTMTSLQRDVAIAYGIRNHRAHNITSSKTILKRFPEVEKAVFRVLLASIDHLY